MKDDKRGDSIRNSKFWFNNNFIFTNKGDNLR